MRLKTVTNLLLLGAATVTSEHNPSSDSDSKVSEGRQFGSPAEDARLFTNLGFFSAHKPQRQPHHHKYPQPQELHHTQWQHQSENSFNEIHDFPETPLPKSAKVPAAEKKTEQQSPALSALALMGFLYFLNLIQQDVLQGDTGRRKRELEGYYDLSEEYLSTLENLMEKVAEVLPKDDEGFQGRGVPDFKAAPSATSEARAFRIFSFVGSLLARIPQAFGLGSKKASSRVDAGVEDSAASSGGGFWSLFGERVSLIARITDFLKDPSPSRVGRNLQEEEHNELNSKEEYAEGEELTAEDRSFLPSPVSSDDAEVAHSRKKRFSEDEMNIWYAEAQDLQNPSYGRSSDGGSGQLLGLVFNLFKDAIIS